MTVKKTVKGIAKEAVKRILRKKRNTLVDIVNQSAFRTKNETKFQILKKAKQVLEFLKNIQKIKNQEKFFHIFF
ncbi:unnamed protein product [Paramecium sonneborni]|uniref:Uncharacterized protein n=1 Tax=Paramecium sonneborni TaxID=65129 RepID=A0A8S1LZX7_9CILI|nr:unnamed protein product [Paramecium sonneborni]